jgi:hypothetical protein
MTKQEDVFFLVEQEARARDQASNSKSATARIAHLARADAYAARISGLKQAELSVPISGNPHPA